MVVAAATTIRIEIEGQTKAALLKLTETTTITMM